MISFFPAGYSFCQTKSAFTHVAKMSALRTMCAFWMPWSWLYMRQSVLILVVILFVGIFDWCDTRCADCIYVNIGTHRYVCFCVAKCHLVGCGVSSRGCNADWYWFMSVRVVWDRSSPTGIGKETVHGLCLFLSTASCGSSFYPVPSLYEHVSVRDVRCSRTYSAKFTV